MDTDWTEGNGSAIDRWNQLHEALADESRRMVIFSLLDVPEERRLPLPEAAESPNTSIDSKSLNIQLEHHHLPKLADAGYIRWERDPFCVQRGPRYEEVEIISKQIIDSLDHLPKTLIYGCEILE
ncbi:DUF7344 domain-containing protein [Natrinema salinisoli]|uniref:DUF7344 domain-containing protein n=1 Tax=Natrinema salinisoli TaxID=2878535 RepID=UPI001CF095D8|nr:hypothetical protein [Natrinema salinisoli]